MYKKRIFFNVQNVSKGSWEKEKEGFFNIIIGQQKNIMSYL